MEGQYYCPDCNEPLEIISGCGSISYFCNKCKLLISKSRILTKEQVEEKGVENASDLPSDKYANE